MRRHIRPSIELVIAGLEPKDFERSYTSRTEVSGSCLAVLAIGGEAAIVAYDSAALRELAATAMWLADAMERLPEVEGAKIRYRHFLADLAATTLAEPVPA